jgi:hypothetical protein
MPERRPPPAVFEHVCRRAGWVLDGDAAVVPLPGGRRQRVGAEAQAEDGEEWLRLSSRIGDAAVLNEPRLLAALRLNARLRLGAIAVVGDALALVDTLRLRDADAGEVQQAVLYLAQKADEFERALFGRDVQ